MACDTVIASTYYHNDGGNVNTGAGAEDTQPAGWGDGFEGFAASPVGPCGYEFTPAGGGTNCGGDSYWDPVCGMCVVPISVFSGTEPGCCLWNALGDCRWAQALCPDSYGGSGSVTRQADCTCCVSCPSGYYWDAATGNCQPNPAGTYTSATSAGAGVKLTRDNAGTPVVAQVLTANALRALRYTDDFPPVQNTFVTVDSAVFGASLRRLPSGRLGVVYGKSGNIEGWFSQDQGRSFPGAAFSVAAGYANPTWRYLPGRGLVVVAMQNATSFHWYVSVGSLGSDGVTWTFSAPAAFVTSASTSYAELLFDPAFGFLFFYADGNGAIQLTQCRELSAAGAGTWSAGVIVSNSTFSDMRQNPTACLAKDRGLVAVAYQVQGTTTTQQWLIVVGALNSGGTSWLFSSEVALQVNGIDATGPPQFADLSYGPDRTFSFVYVDGSGNIDLVRCRNLAASGTGTWSAS